MEINQELSILKESEVECRLGKKINFLLWQKNKVISYIVFKIQKPYPTDE